MSDKKKFKDTKLGAFLTEKLPDAVGMIGNVLPDAGALGILKNIISSSGLSPADKMEAQRLLMEEELLYMEDRASARSREVEMAKTGKNDWLMYVAGCVALGAFVLMVVAVVFIPNVKDNPLFHQLMGIIEGVALTIFAYYFGTSKSSNDKTKMMGR